MTIFINDLLVGKLASIVLYLFNLSICICMPVNDGCIRPYLNFLIFKLLTLNWSQALCAGIRTLDFLYNFTLCAFEKLYHGFPNGGTVIIGVRKPS